MIQIFLIKEDLIKSQRFHQNNHHLYYHHLNILLLDID